MNVDAQSVVDQVMESMFRGYDQTHPDVVDGSDFESSRIGSENFLFEIVRVVETIVSHICRFAQRKGKLAVSP